MDKEIVKRIIVMQYGSLSEFARRIGVVQPYVSMAIACDRRYPEIQEQIQISINDVPEEVIDYIEECCEEQNANNNN